MRNMFWRLLLCLAFSAAVLFTERSARATLGGSADSVESDRRALSAVRGGTMVHNSYSVEQIDYGGLAVREYVSPEGNVYDVSHINVRLVTNTSDKIFLIFGSTLSVLLGER
jgi:Protein of unknown function (DUF2844)